MKINKWLRVAVFVAALSVVITSFEPQYGIRSPRLGNPHMVLSDGSFDVVLDGMLPFFQPDDIAFKLMSPQQECALEIDSVADNVFRVHPLSDLTPGAYELSAYIDGKWYKNPKAVFVYQKFPSDFTIAHAADLPDLDNGDGEKLFISLLNDVERERADILLLTGDVVYHGGAERYQTFYQGIAQLDIPVILCPGNHEREDWALFIKDYPDPVHVNLFGDWNIISLDSAHGRDQLTSTQLAWFEKQLIKHKDKKTLVQIHHPVVGARSIERNQQRFLELLSEHNVAATLSGHTHVDAIHTSDGEEWLSNELPDQPWLITTTTYDFDVAAPPNGGLSFPGYRMLRFENNELNSIGKLYDNGRSFMSERVDLKSKLK
ncbi:MAG: metallophosphoesterase [Planctomycetes bacterium]|nr:metallophosphoesterase [Planctomycetota bacterium]